MVVNCAFGALGVVYAGSFAYLYLRCRDRLAFNKYLSNHVLMFAPPEFPVHVLHQGAEVIGVRRESFPGLERIKENYEVIRAEAKVLLDTGVFQRPPATDSRIQHVREGRMAHYPLNWYTKECAPRRCEHARKHAPLWI